MGFKLLLLDWWTPKYIVRRELQSISTQTLKALRNLIPDRVEDETNQKLIIPKNIEEQRAAMAKTQAEVVERLEAALGHNEAVKFGREALFLVGQEIGKETRTKLGVGDSPIDLVKAAKILYRILGIDFSLEWIDGQNAVATINRCSLAGHYSKLTCEVLSATDEGVINGLQPNVTMKFIEYMTNGCSNCKAQIHFNDKETL